MKKFTTRMISQAALAFGLLLMGFTASAATISMVPSSPTVADGATFSIDIAAVGLPDSTTGGSINVNWTAADMTLDSVVLATTPPGTGPWEPSFSTPGTIGAGTLTGLTVSSFLGVVGNAPIATLNFTLGTGVVDSLIGMSVGPEGWSGVDPAGSAFAFTNDYNGATVNAVIPVPAAVWLFGSGLLGLVGVARRRQQG